MKAKLAVILKTKFLMAFTGFFFVLIITFIILSQIYFKNVYKGDLNDYLGMLDNNKMKPAIDLAHSLMYNRFQQVVLMLEGLHRAFKEQVENGPFTDYIELGSPYPVYLRPVISIIDVQRQFSTFVSVKASSPEAYDDKTLWIHKNIQNEVLDTTDGDGQLIYDYINAFQALVPTLKTFYDTYKMNPLFKFDMIYFLNLELEMTILYPFSENKHTLYNMMGYMDNEDFCVNKNGEKFEQFFFSCRDWYLSLKDAYKKSIEKGYIKKFFVTEPYRVSYDDALGANRLIVTACHAFNNPRNKVRHTKAPNYGYYSTDVMKDQSLICVDFFMDNLIDSFETLNSNLNGYFYAMPTFNDQPLFYPNYVNNKYVFDLVRNEFPTDNLHYVNQVEYFRTKVLKDVSGYYRTANLELKGEEIIDKISRGDTTYELAAHIKDTFYHKFDAIFNYTVFPVLVKNDCDESDEDYEAIANLIYTLNVSSLGMTEDSFKQALNKSLLNYIFIIFFLGLLFVFLTSQLMLNYAKNVTRPIKDIRERLKVPNTENAQKENNTNNKKEEDKNVEDALEELMEGGKKNEDENLVIEEEEEEILAINNKEIKGNFDLLLALKKVFLFLESSRATYQKKFVVDFFSSSEVFEVVGNNEGKNLCLSNIGNLTNLCGKYDKAIIYFLEAVGLGQIENYKIPQLKMEKVLEQVDEYFKSVSAYAPSSDSNSSNFRDEDFNRFLKLFYAYKKFLSCLKKIKGFLEEIKKFSTFKVKKKSDRDDREDEDKNLLTGKDEDENKEKQYQYVFSGASDSVKHRVIRTLDFYVEKHEHTTESFEQVILACIEKICNSKELNKPIEKLLSCLLELFHFKINTLKMSQIDPLLNNDGRQNPLQKNKSPEEIMEEIKIVQDHIAYVIIDDDKGEVTQSSIQHIKSLLYDIKNIENNENTIHLNYFALEQLFYYLLGKLAKLCGHKYIACKYYFKVIYKNFSAFEKRLVQSFGLSKKANEKIISILQELEEDKKIKNSKDAEKIRSNEKLKESAKQLITQLKTYSSRLDSNPKHVSILVDLTKEEKMYDKVHLRKHKTMKQIFESFLSKADYVAIYTYQYEEPLKKIIPLTRKNPDNYFFIQCTLDSIIKTENNAKFVKKIDRIQYLRETLKALNTVCFEHALAKVDQHIILFTETLQVEENENEERIADQTFGEVTASINRNDFYIHIIGDLLLKHSKLNAAEKALKSKGFQDIFYYEYENYQEIKHYMIKTGKFPRGYEFQNEELN